MTDLIREPTPNGPPVQPVSHQPTTRAMFSNFSPEQISVDHRMMYHKGSAKTGTECCLRFFYALLSASHFGGITGKKIVHRVFGCIQDMGGNTPKASAVKQNVPNNKIVNMAIAKLKKKIDDTSVLSPGINPFLEGGTFDPAARERTGHTGAIIGFDGSFIVSEVPDFDGIIDLREPERDSDRGVI